MIITTIKILLYCFYNRREAQRCRVNNNLICVSLNRTNTSVHKYYLSDNKIMILYNIYYIILLSGLFSIAAV